MEEPENVGALLRKHLGKEAGDAMAAKIDKMISEKNSAAEIEAAIQADLIEHIGTRKTAAKWIKFLIQLQTGLPVAANKPTIPFGLLYLK